MFDTRLVTKPHTWQAFEAGCLVPAEKVARAVVREKERGGDPDPEARAIEAIVLGNVDLFVAHWRCDKSVLVDAFKLPDATVAPLFLRTLKSERKKAAQRGDLNPNDNPAWRKAREVLYEATQRLGYMPARALRAAMHATKMPGTVGPPWIIICQGGEPIGYIERKRVDAELSSCKDAPRWTVDAERKVWACTWANGRGGLRCPLAPLPPGYDRKPAVLLDTEALVKDEQAAAQSMREPEPEPATVADQPERGTQTMAKQSKATDPGEVLAIDALAECDRLGANVSCFGTNGRKSAMCVMYTRAKPSRKIAQGKGATLHEAFAACLKAANEQEGVTDATDANIGDMF